MIKAVLFDADEVVINSKRFSQTLADDYGITKEITNNFFMGEFPQILVGQADLKQHLPKYLKTWGYAGTVNEFLNLWFTSEHQIDQKMIKYIKALKKKGLKVCIATNQEKYRTQYIVEEMGFGKIFDQIFSSAHIGHKKPSPEFFQHILKKLDLGPGEVMFWDNSSANVDAAKILGIKAYKFRDLEVFKKIMQQAITAQL